jgi:hypothetical protein
MKTIQLRNSTLQLPDSWEDLSYKEKLFTFGILSQLFSGALTPEVARLKMLIEYTGYKPSWIQLFRETLQKDAEQRETIHFNLFRLSEELTFAFTVQDNLIVPNHTFTKNPIYFVKTGRNKYMGRRFELDAVCRTDITAREFSDCFDIFASMQTTDSETTRSDYINQICAILFPQHPNYVANLVSGHHNEMKYVDPIIKFGIIFWFTGIIQYYANHPLYSLLFKGEKQPEDYDNKIHLGMNEITLALLKEGYGPPNTMNLNDYFDAQIKLLKDRIGKALADGLKPEKIAQKTGIPLSTIQKLS